MPDYRIQIENAPVMTDEDMRTFEEEVVIIFYKWFGREATEKIDSLKMDYN